MRKLVFCGNIAPGAEIWCFGGILRPAPGAEVRVKPRFQGWSASKVRWPKYIFYRPRSLSPAI